MSVLNFIKKVGTDVRHGVDSVGAAVTGGPSPSSGVFDGVPQNRGGGIVQQLAPFVPRIAFSHGDNAPAPGSSAAWQQSQNNPNVYPLGKVGGQQARGGMVDNQVAGLSITDLLSQQTVAPRYYPYFSSGSDPHGFVYRNPGNLRPTDSFDPQATPILPITQIPFPTYPTSGKMRRL